MSHFLDRLNHFSLPKENFSGEHGVTTGEDRTWEDAYRNRWAHDKIVRSTHGVNCTGSCSWKIYVKGGIVTWETQQTDYPRTRWDMPNHEPRGCARGASYSWYLYSANRVKYPMVRGRLLERWRAALKVSKTPVDAWGVIVEDPAARRDYQQVRGMGGFVRSSWDEVNQLIAAANVYTIKKHGADRVVGFSPIPAMSMVSYAAGSRYLSLIGGVCMSFYDWYCDLPPSSPQVWGEQTDVPESADWYNSRFIAVVGANLNMTRTPDTHFISEVRHAGAKLTVFSPDFSQVAKYADYWLPVHAGVSLLGYGFLALAFCGGLMYLARSITWHGERHEMVGAIPPGGLLVLQEHMAETGEGYAVEADVTIWVDGTPLATLTESPYQAWWQLSAGEHRFWATGVTINGETVTSEVIVVTVTN